MKVSCLLWQGNPEIIMIFSAHVHRATSTENHCR
jgi:hypothetical protein